MTSDFSKGSIAAKSKKRLWQRQLQDLKDRLGGPEKYEDDLISVQEARTYGTCE